MFDYKTALNQLTMSNNGLSRLAIMIGAKDFSTSRRERSISFKFPHSNSINYCSLSLGWDDLYTLELGYIHGHNYTVRKKFEGLFFDQLKEIFENETKLYLSLS